MTEQIGGGADARVGQQRTLQLLQVIDERPHAQALAQVNHPLENCRRADQIRRLLALAVHPVEQDRKCLAEKRRTSWWWGGGGVATAVLSSLLTGS